jgi:hypothetical protein
MATHNLEERQKEIKFKLIGKKTSAFWKSKRENRVLALAFLFPYLNFCKSHNYPNHKNTVFKGAKNLRLKKTRRKTNGNKDKTCVVNCRIFFLLLLLLSKNILFPLFI